MVHKYGKSAALNCYSGGRCSLSVIIWILAVWILILHAYNTFAPKSPQLKPQAQSHRLSLYREYEDVEDRGFEVKQRGKKFLSSSAKSKGKKHTVVDDFLDVTSQRRQLYFPDRSLAVSPLKSDGHSYYFWPGRVWLDTEGRPIQAHGGGVLYVEGMQTFYWYGENKDGKTYHFNKKGAARVDIIGVSCYSSRDLWTWKNEGVVLPAEKINKTHDLYVNNVLERPKVIYNDRTKEYVMWTHIDNANYSKASVGVAVSSYPTGPFHYIGSKRPHGCDSRDMTLFKDDNGEAYLVYSSEDNTVLHIGLLTDDYKDLTQNMRRVLIGEHREAPAVFKHKGLYYMITSGCTGWAPNSALAHSAESMLGSWETLGNPCIGGNEDFRSTTFFSQGTFVLPLPGMPDIFIFMADRWNPADLRDSRYVWLPLTMDGPADEPMDDDFEFPIWSRVSIYWHKKWKLPEGWNVPFAQLS
eukprot:TRINITY_DN3793_c0_g1_i2.p1 TRINITY_DN3793_c0_g1~~TRINITY_DN3793_c0_g1_i2.p1  ORF type:complete len:468 (-),score=70.84 TRINITY_DN3793_c0_g1_i2:516-1919(-)